MAELPQFLDTPARVVAAQSAFDATKLRHEEIVTRARDARTREAEALDKLNAETQLLKQAEHELCDATIAGTLTAKLDVIVRKHEESISSLSRIHRVLKRNADTVDSNIVRSSQALMEAERQLAEAEFDDLKFQYAQSIVGAIPLARKIHERASRFRFNTQLSGYLIDPARPTLGMLQVRDDGTLYLPARFSI